MFHDSVSKLYIHLDFQRLEIKDLYWKIDSLEKRIIVLEARDMPSFFFPSDGGIGDTQSWSNSNWFSADSVIGFLLGSSYFKHMHDTLTKKKPIIKHKKKKIMSNAGVLLSGGQDSATCLYWAKEKFNKVIAIGFDYGQKHSIEIQKAQIIASKAKVEYKLFNIKGALGGSSLTDFGKSHNSEHTQDASLPASFTPGRNMLFLTIAAGFLYGEGIRDIVTGVCQTDYSGYPDCRQSFIDSIKETLSYAMNPNYDYCNPHTRKLLFEIHTPLMHLTKAETWKLAKELGCLDIIINDTMTDYNGDTTMNEWGMGVNNNPATALRVKGYYEAKEKGWI